MHAAILTPMHPEDSKIVHDLVQLHIGKMSCVPRASDERCAYFLEMTPDGTVPLDCCFVKCDVDVCKTRFDVDQRSVQWLMQQLHTYDPQKEWLAGAVLPCGEPLAHVFPKRSGKKAGRRSLSA